jgi:hypothetical protein
VKVFGFAGGFDFVGTWVIGCGGGGGS